MPRFPLAEWQAEHARITIFPMSDVEIAWRQWWTETVGSDPDDITVNPKKGSGAMQAAYGPGKLTLKTEPGRIDWILGPTDAIVEESISTGKLPFLGATVDVLEAFSAIATRWLSREDTPVVGRFAFGTALIHPEASRDAAYDRLPEYVPVQLPPGSTDFLFQINRPQRSTTGIDGLMINRLSRWNVMLLKTSAVSTFPRPFEAFNLRLELDINTAPTFEGPIPRERLVDIYHELVSEGMQMASNGIPTL